MGRCLHPAGADLDCDPWEAPASQCTCGCPTLRHCCLELRLSVRCACARHPCSLKVKVLVVGAPHPSWQLEQLSHLHASQVQVHSDDEVGAVAAWAHALPNLAVLAQAPYLMLPPPVHGDDWVVYPGSVLGCSTKLVAGQWWDAGWGIRGAAQLPQLKHFCAVETFRIRVDRFSTSLALMTQLEHLSLRFCITTCIPMEFHQRLPQAVMSLSRLQTLWLPAWVCDGFSRRMLQRQTWVDLFVTLPALTEVRFLLEKSVARTFFCRGEMLAFRAQVGAGRAQHGRPALSLMV